MPCVLSPLLDDLTARGECLFESIRPALVFTARRYDRWTIGGRSRERRTRHIRRSGKGASTRSANQVLTNASDEDRSDTDGSAAASVQSWIPHAYWSNQAVIAGSREPRECRAMYLAENPYARLAVLMEAQSNSVCLNAPALKMKVLLASCVTLAEKPFAVVTVR